MSHYIWHKTACAFWQRQNNKSVIADLQSVWLTLDVVLQQTVSKRNEKSAQNKANVKIKVSFASNVILSLENI